MTHTAIMAWDVLGRVTKMMDFATQSEAAAHVLAHGETYPLAFVVPTLSAPLAEWLIDGQAKTVSISARSRTADEVIVERERRLALGFDYDFSDARGVHRIGTTEADMKGWEEVDKAASALIALGQGSQALNIVTDTGSVVVTAIEWKMIILAATANRQPIWAASFALQAMETIPADFADDQYWD